MNFARIAAAAVVAWIVSIGIGFVVNDVLLVGLIDSNAAAMRPDADVLANLPVGFAALLVGFFAFAYMYAKGYEGGSGVVEGIRFGVLTALVVCGFGIVWIWVTFPITWQLGASMLVDSVVELAVYGAIVGAIYKPLPRAARAAV